MIHTPMDILQRFPVRKTSKQKQSFRDAVCPFLEGLGYSVAVENGKYESRNVVAGDPETAEYLITAHYDTCVRLPFPNYITPCNALAFYLSRTLVYAVFIVLGILLGAATAGIPNMVLGYLVVSGIIIAITLLMLFGPANTSNVNDNTSGVITLLEIAASMPKNLRHKVCFVLFDLEEAGLIGSGSYRKTHKEASDRQLVLNLDCVGDGDHILMIPTKKLKKDRKKLSSLYKACGYFGKKSLLLRDTGFSAYPSDQRHFPYGVGICALNKGKWGLYLSRIHTPKDTVLDHTNVNILRAALISYISCHAVNLERKK